MKRLILAAALLMGASAVLPTSTMTLSAQTCDPNSPCLYTGTAKSSANSPVQITVKFDANREPVAEVQNYGTYYVMLSETEADKALGTHYVNVNGTKYYFSM